MNTWSKERQLSVSDLESVASFIDKLNQATACTGVRLDSYAEMYVSIDDRTIGYVVFDRESDAYVYQRETVN